MTLSGDQNEVFEYLVLQSLPLMTNFRKSTFSAFDFYGLIIVYTKALTLISLWRRQKYHQRATLNFMHLHNWDLLGFPPNVINNKTRCT